MSARRYRRDRGFENIATAGNLGTFDRNRFQYEVADEIGLNSGRLNQNRVDELESKTHGEGTGTEPTRTGTTTRTAGGAGGAGRTAEERSAGGRTTEERSAGGRTTGGRTTGSPAETTGRTPPRG